MQAASVEDQLAEQRAKLSLLTGMSTKDWADVMACTGPQQNLLLEGYTDMDWADNTSTISEVISIMNVVLTIASGVAGVAGAVSGVGGIVQMLRSL
jgi:hypothetical protein